MTGGKSGKGLGGTVRRAALLPQRYGLSPEKVRTRLREMAALTARWEVTPTVPATAIILDRHPGIAKELAAMDPAIHGHRHIPYAGLPASDQAKDLDAARATFARHGLPARGFRAPYLSASDTTLRLLRERAFTFDSSAAKYVLPENDPLSKEAIRLTETRYGRVQRGVALPRTEGDLVELPIALPDDEILADGLGIRNGATLQGIFERMMAATHDAGSLLVFQIHPERFPLFSEPIGEVLARAHDLGAWCASLSEVASWVLKNPAEPTRWPKGHSMALAVTGDLDAVSLGDFARRVVGG